jgi:hypothetical protein
MIEQSVACPHCGKKIPLTEALTHPIEEKLRKEFDSETRKSEREHEAAIDTPIDDNVRKLYTRMGFDNGEVLDLGDRARIRTLVDFVVRSITPFKLDPSPLRY